MFRAVRILILLLVLATVAQTAWLSARRATAWKETLHVAIYPINADGSAATEAYLRRLSVADFAPIRAFFERELTHYGVTLLRPVDLALAPPRATQPPAPPAAGGALDAVLWSLRFRWWAWRHDAIDGPRPQVRLFVRYHDAATHDRLAHSVGLEKGLLGLVNAYAGGGMGGRNNVVIAHELLHALGASDKYVPGSNLPRHPDGYAEPDRQPLHPQELAEIMGGRIPLAPGEAEIPPGLEACVIGPATAREVGILRP